MIEKDKLIIKNFFKEYYYRNHDIILKHIKDIESREFGYINFEGTMIRHVSLDRKTFPTWIKKVIPRDLYHSSAYYLFPDKDMLNKGWVGADLIFDIDLDHFWDFKPKVIEIYKNKNNYTINKDDIGKKVAETTILDEESILRAKKELIRLMDKLVNDLDISLEKMTIYYSGHRGFHLHIYDEKIREMDSYSRMEIKDYLTLDGFDILNLKTLDNWPIRKLKEIINNKNYIFNFFNEKELNKISYLLNCGKKERYRLLKMNKKLRYKLNEFIVKYIGIHIDGIVTVDISRLIRVPYSIHGKTGLVKIYIDYDNIDDFNPLTNAVIDDKRIVKVKIIYCPEIIWDKKEYKEILNEEKEIPISLAVYLTLRGLAYDIKY